MIDRRGFVLSGLAAVAAGPAAAQDSWWDKAGKLWDQYGGGAKELSVGEIAQGLKEALRVGTGSVVGQLGRLDGVITDPTAHLPLPDVLKQAQQVAGIVGLSGLLDDLELRLNRAAETATPKAKAIFWDAISAMTIDDAMGIYNGPEDAATQYFKGNMTEPLTTTFRPVVEHSLAEAGAIRSFDQFMTGYSASPLLPALGANMKGRLVDHVIGGTL